ncbi:hypothetical protein [Vibrio barjaei]|uniref:hypothetical protein n=1 Tax=Vibrio barjaei TaxID=1676683 RepID=UPI00228404E5|nr:hypothetical protein [Vibrio barjaei]MCY9874065.1 hypothetical protein [Vibrio barjaei]
MITNTAINKSQATKDSRLLWVSGFELSNTSTFNWFDNQDDANTHHNNNLSKLILHKAKCHLFAYAVDKHLTNHEINSEIDRFYHTNSRNKDFYTNPNVTSQIS